jgi:hypothetical protein
VKLTNHLKVRMNPCGCTAVPPPPIWNGVSLIIATNVPLSTQIPRSIVSENLTVRHMLILRQYMERH